MLRREYKDINVSDSPFDNYLDLVEASRVLGIHPQSLRRLIKQGRVPATLFAGKYLERTFAIYLTTNTNIPLNKPAITPTTMKRNIAFAVSTVSLKFVLKTAT